MVLPIGISNVKGRKRGNLSTAEMIYIDANTEEMTYHEIAKVLNRTVGPVKRYLKTQNVKRIKYTKGDEKLLNLLHNRHYWAELLNQFDEDELRFFEFRWIDYFKQFSEDLTASEETLMVELIRISILINRIMKDKQDINIRVNSLQDLIDVEMKRADDQINTELVGNMQTQVAGYLAAKGSFIREYDLLTTKMEKLSVSLKGDRRQRKQKSDDSTTSFNGYCRFLDTENSKNVEGRYMSMLDLAAAKSEDKLTEWHEFSDGTVDKPLLSGNIIED